MDSACPERDATEILSNSDHSTKVAPTTLKKSPIASLKICLIMVLTFLCLYLAFLLMHAVNSHENHFYLVLHRGPAKKCN